MCKYCEITEYPLPVYGLNVDGYIKQGRSGKTHYIAMTVFDHIIGIENIKYCPFCGRKLEVD